MTKTDAPRSLAELAAGGPADRFADRHLGPRGDDVAAMLASLGAGSLDELLDQAVPPTIRGPESARPLALGGPVGEQEALARLRAKADRNQVLRSMIGAGWYGTVTPPVILRNILENPAWYTAYTPYQPEISQGRLEALLNFQTMVADLTGLDLAGASLLDEATAAAEAMTLCRRQSRQKADTFLVDGDCHPQVIDVVRTRAAALRLDVVVVDGDALAGADPAALAAVLPEGGVFGVLLAEPGSSGAVRDHAGVIAAVHAQGGLVAVAADLLACVLLEPPGTRGADVVVGSAQRFGVPMGFGGPHAGFMAVREEHRRSLPGRLVGVSVDTKGRTGLRLALQTREQHIRRERATSNICTAQVLLAVMASTYAVHHGPAGLRVIAERAHRFARVIAAGLDQLPGTEVLTPRYFDTITVEVAGRAAAVAGAARAGGVNLRVLDADHVGVSCDETTTVHDAAVVLAAFGATTGVDELDAGLAAEDPSLPAAFARQAPLLGHPVFHRYHSETELLRYLRRLADRDLALDRTMIPLGSCTMKLNATAEMIPVTWPEFADIHPYAPLDQAAGYLEMIHELEDLLVEITGYDAVSLQPNAGSQGELSGLLAIRGYHLSRGDHGRDVCLIPGSAHGTNAASAVMAGLQVVVVATDESGDVDVVDLRAKLAAHDGRVAALMVTYPSTHGVFEERIVEICDLVHAAGAQVYLDGANLNALVGVARPGAFGADVSHLNLHKTFCIPHGGGGPGVGPVCVRGHLAPFLPGHPVVPEAGPVGRWVDRPDPSGVHVGAVSAAPWGSAGILPISWMYITMMGAAGLREATAVAILNANYVAARLADAYPVLYRGAHGRVAHECILDLRPLAHESGVTAEDVAKRLIDYGFHAPTLSFPVAGTLMVEPTESESRHELDRFCAAMLAIRAEIDAVVAGTWPRDDNPCHNAPHPAEDVIASDWARPYSREVAGFPVDSLRGSKYWPPVSRIDAAYGDRNVVCACPPISAYA